jgi:broad specificity phosphatase PhoE
MAKLYLVRHGEPTGTWGVSPDPDPGLSALGHSQASAAAERLLASKPSTIITSPLRRAAETAAPLSRLMGLAPIVTPPVSEIPTPAHIAQEDRATWLRMVMTQSWDQLDPFLRQWRQDAIACLAGMPTDTAVFSHYVLINVAVGAAIGDDRVHCFAPAHASVTVLETNGSGLTLLELGTAGQSAIR